MSKNYSPGKKWLQFIVGDSVYFDMDSRVKIAENFSHLKEALSRVVEPTNLRSDSLNVNELDFEFIQQFEKVIDFGEHDFNSIEVGVVNNFLYAAHSKDSKKVVKYQLSPTEFYKLAEIDMCDYVTRDVRC